jgi:hypothetical protein
MIINEKPNGDHQNTDAEEIRDQEEHNDCDNVGHRDDGDGDGADDDDDDGGDGDDDDDNNNNEEEDDDDHAIGTKDLTSTTASATPKPSTDVRGKRKKKRNFHQRKVRRQSRNKRPVNSSNEHTQFQLSLYDEARSVMEELELVMSELPWSVVARCPLSYHS